MEELDFEVNDREDDGIMDHLLIGREAMKRRFDGKRRRSKTIKELKMMLLNCLLLLFKSLLQALYLFAVVLQRL